MWKKGQVTLFVIVGLVIFLSMMLVFSVSSSFQREQQRQAIIDSIDEFVHLNSLEHYIGSCIDQTTQEGLDLLGKQGGVLYTSQGGLTPDFDNDGNSILERGKDYGVHQIRALNPETNEWETRQINISYVIRKQVPCSNFNPPMQINYDDPTTGFYPKAKTRLQDLEYVYEQLISQGGCFGTNNMLLSRGGFLGANALAHLCFIDGPNAPNRDTGVTFCPISSYDQNKHSFNRDIQSQLASYVKHHLSDCVDFTIYERISPYNITVDVTRANVSVILQQPRGLLVRAQYPFIITLEGQVPIVELIDFQKSLPIDLQNFYVYMNDVFIRIARDPFFNFRTDWNDVTKIPSYKDTYDLSFTRLACDPFCATNERTNTVVTLKETSSFVKGVPLTFNFILENRPPVLDYYHESSTSGAVLQFEVTDVEINYQVLEDQKIDLEIKAIDSDGDDFTFNFIGWNYDYTKKLNASCCEELSGCTLINYKRCIITEYIETPEWEITDSGSGGKRFVYDTTPDDLGLHFLVIEVEDQFGNKDFQNVSFFVFDFPKAEMNGTNFFDDIPNNFASIEDIYLFDASQSRGSILMGTGDLEYVLIDTTERKQIIQTDSLFYIPNETLTFREFIQIPNLYFTQRFLNTNPSGVAKTHTFELTVNQTDTEGNVLTSSPFVQDITVGQCLPHGFNTSVENAWPYVKNYYYDHIPFDDREGVFFYFFDDSVSFNDVLRAPHVCCRPANDYRQNGLTTGTFLPDTVSCFDSRWVFEEPQVTCVPDIAQPPRPRVLQLPLIKNLYYSDATRGVQPISLLLLTRPTLISNPALYSQTNFQNDIFSYAVQQQCSGSRGNVCSGDVSIDMRIQAQCIDFRSPTQFARCQGPGIKTESGSYNPIIQFGDDVQINTPNCQGELFNQGDLGCANYEKGQTFEKSFLGFQSRIQFWNPSFIQIQNRQKIVEGACDFARFNIDDTNVVRAMNGLYSCNVFCDGEGGCTSVDFETDCSCHALSSDAGCRNINISRFKDHDYYVAHANYVCSKACKQQTMITKAGCYARVNELVQDSTFSDVDFESFTHYFDSPYLFSTPILGGCCSGGNIITLPSNIPDDVSKSVCYRGDVYASGSVVDNTNNNLLSYGGHLYSCGGTTINPIRAQPVNTVKGDFCCTTQRRWADKSICEFMDFEINPII